MEKRYRYLVSKSTQSQPRFLPLITMLVKLCATFMFGIVIGFNARDLMTKTCMNHLKEQQKTSTRSLIRIPDVQIHSSTFKELPAKFYQIHPPKRPALLFPLEPWKYQERLKQNFRKYFMTFIVKSASPLVERRFLIRRTWGSVNSLNNEKFGLIFLIGLTKTREEQSLLEQESELYGDILQSDVQDDYFHLHIKVLAGFQWITYHLGNTSDFFVTTDDDCVVNIAAVYDYFLTNKNNAMNTINCGYIYDKGDVPVRQKISKWGIPYEAYAKDVYPNFCHGGLIIWPFSHLRQIYLASETTNYTGLHLEDVLLSGILRQKVYNSDTSITPRGFNGMRGKFHHPEPFTWHLGKVKDLPRSFKLRWFRCKTGFRLDPEDQMIGKQESAYFFNATIEDLAVLSDSNVSKTLSYFIISWRNIRPVRRIVNHVHEELNMIVFEKPVAVESVNDFEGNVNQQKQLDNTIRGHELFEH